MKRKPRVGEYICRCGAYKFPHRMMGGDCDGGALVERTFETQMWGACRDCMMREEAEDQDGCKVWKCQVLEGRDTLMQCPELQEHVRFNEIKLYGVNKP